MSRFLWTVTFTSFRLFPIKRKANIACEINISQGTNTSPGIIGEFF